MVGADGNGIKCVVVGDGAVGKTSMLLNYTTKGYTTDYVPTFFDSFDVNMACDNQTFKVNFVDTAGQVTYDRLRTLAYYNTDLFIICFSLVDPTSFENIGARWLPELKEYKPRTPYMLVGTHLDVREDLIKDGQQSSRSVKDRSFITHRKASKWAKRYGAAGYVECSSLTGDGIGMVFQLALHHVVAPKRENYFRKSLRRMFWKI